MSSFGSYSKSYDLIYRDKDYEGEANYIIKLLESSGIARGSKILELGTGTGRHACLLAAHGYTVTGIDLSDKMVEIGNARVATLPQELAGRVTIKQGDVTTFESSDRFDAVISIFHVFSYQNEDAQVKAMLGVAKKHLKSGGVFIFDYWHQGGVESDPPVLRVKRIANSELEVTRIAEPKWNREKRVVEVNYQVFSKDLKTGRIDEVKEKHPMRYFGFPEVARCLDQAGFRSPTHLEWMSMNPAKATSWNVVTITRS